MTRHDDGHGIAATGTADGACAAVQPMRHVAITQYGTRGNSLEYAPDTLLVRRARECQGQIKLPAGVVKIGSKLAGGVTCQWCGRRPCRYPRGEKVDAAYGTVGNDAEHAAR